MSMNGELREVELPMDETSDDDIPFDFEPDGDSGGEAVDLDDALDGEAGPVQAETYEELVAMVARLEAERDAAVKALTTIRGMASVANHLEIFRAAVLAQVGTVLEVAA